MSLNPVFIVCMYFRMNSADYTNSTEYRQLFRIITDQSLDIPSNPFNIDDESLDESNYDDTRVSVFLDTVYNKTKESPLFQTLYDLAAAQMISTNREIGLAVLCSYDYLKAFYPLYCEYAKSPTSINDTTELYLQIRNLL